MVQAQQTPAANQAANILIQGATLHIGDGSIIENGMIGIANGKIIEIGETGSTVKRSFNLTILKPLFLEAEKSF